MSSVCIEIIFLIPEVLFEVDAHLCLHDPEAASDDTFVVDLLDLEAEILELKQDEGSFSNI